MESQQTLTAIRDGQYDAELDAIQQAIRSRIQYVAQSQLVQLRPGDTVRFNSRSRPEYLRGLTATVKNINETTATVVLPATAGRFTAGSPIRVPASLLQKA